MKKVDKTENAVNALFDTIRSSSPPPDIYILVRLLARRFYQLGRETGNNEWIIVAGVLDAEADEMVVPEETCACGGRCSARRA